MNTLYYGDNLDILRNREYLPSESVDLIYLDPPFKSDQEYNVLFAEQNGSRSASQIQAFKDTWHWDRAASKIYEETVEGGGRVADALRAFRELVGASDMLAYLAMMAPRLAELHRVLKPTGSMYLHCDPTASHYLKVLLDAVFGPQRFRNEVVWKRTPAHSAAKRWNDVHDCLLFYRKSDIYTWREILLPHSNKYLARFKRGWTDDNLTAPGVRGGESGATWKGYNPSANGSHWKVSNSAVKAIVGDAGVRGMGTLRKLDLLDEHGLILRPKGEGFPRFKRYPSSGATVQDIITDIDPINSQAQERLGYPTQKPEALLERIIKVSSDEGATVLDPFCGCGTAVAVAQRLNRRWIGIDITHLAIGLIRHRLISAFGHAIVETFEVIGEPTDLAGARALSLTNRFQFQCWALGRVGARHGGKGADRGIDGKLDFHDEPQGGKTKQIIFSVKSGKVGVGDVRDLCAVVGRENAEMGVLITLESDTRPMRTEASGAGLYKSPWGTHPRIQILTVAEILSGEGIDMPPLRQVDRTFKKAPRAKTAQAEAIPLPLDAAE
jgi:DNA modification methylase